MTGSAAARILAAIASHGYDAITRHKRVRRRPLRWLRVKCWNCRENTGAKSDRACGPCRRLFVETAEAISRYGVGEVDPTTGRCKVGGPR